MSFLLDNSVSNFTAWRLSISENVSRLKFGAHAVHLTLSQDAPTFRARPQIDDVNMPAGPAEAEAGGGFGPTGLSGGK